MVYKRPLKHGSPKSILLAVTIAMAMKHGHEHG